MPHAPTARPARRPPDARPFVGRTAELAQLDALLSRARLVTITGPGGVGKTRLAQRAAARAAAASGLPVTAVGLSAVADPRLLPHAIAARLGLTEQDVSSAREAVLRYLRDRKTLLVLDTCEHLLDDCAELVEVMLRDTDGTTVLTTSRQPLDVVGESILPLAPLAVPAGTDEAGRTDASELFAQLAARAVPGFAITPDNASDVAAVCRRADGIPLAIEVAAARLRTMSVAELARQSSVVAPGGPVDRALTWSYGLCDEAERLLWERLSVFAGPFTVEAAEEVCSGRGLPRDAVLETLIGLVDKSVLARDAGDGMEGDPDDGPARFRQLDTVREFGMCRLADSGTVTAVRRRLIDRYLARARHFRDHFADDDQAGRLAALRHGHANLQAALGYCLLDDASREFEVLGAELATALFGYWQAAGLQREGTHWMDRVLERFPGPGRERVRALGVRCYLGTTAGDGRRAIEDGRACVRLAAGLGDELAEARGYLYLCHALTVAGDYPAALDAGSRAEPRLKELRDGIGLRILAAHMAHAHQLAGNLSDADVWYRRGVDLWGRTDERWSTGWLHLVGGYTFLQQGRLEECAAAWRVALRKKHSIGDVVGTGFALEAFSMLAVARGQDEQAAWLFGAAEPMWNRAGAMLSANRPLLELRQGLFSQVRGRLGARRFDVLFGRGERCPLPAAIEAAGSDSGFDALPGPAEPQTLTRREEEVAELAITGLSNREIAERMTVSKRTVDTHIEHIYAKTGVSSRIALARWLRSRA
ncbi:MAG: LuxR C-terminal-related transcriptional regulator [Streptosporangiales bacterium]|nr:LuxR C-terminal-related transcriptional regulator [Streptosporangiales bacterium]